MSGPQSSAKASKLLFDQHYIPEQQKSVVNQTRDHINLPWSPALHQMVQKLVIFRIGCNVDVQLKSKYTLAAKETKINMSGTGYAVASTGPKEG